MSWIKSRKKFRGILAIFLIIAVLLCGYYWENYGRQQFTYTNIIVFKTPVSANTIVKKNMLGIMNVERSSLIEDAITDPNQVIGKETTTYIPAKLQLTKKFFSNVGMSTGEGKYTFKIPESWIYSFPQTLRRGDEIYIYLIPEDQNNEMYSAGASFIDYQDKPLFSTKVVYVKDTANREIKNVDNNNRYDGTSVAAQIEVIITEELYNKLCKAHEEGYMFNILYK